MRVLTSVSSTSCRFCVSAKICNVVSARYVFVCASLCRYISKSRKWHNASAQLRAGLQGRCIRCTEGVRQVETVLQCEVHGYKREGRQMSRGRGSKRSIGSMKEGKERRGRDTKVDQQVEHSRVRASRFASVLASAGVCALRVCMFYPCIHEYTRPRASNPRVSALQQVASTRCARIICSRGVYVLTVFYPRMYALRQCIHGCTLCLCIHGRPPPHFASAGVCALHACMFLSLYPRICACERAAAVASTGCARVIAVADVRPHRFYPRMYALRQCIHGCTLCLCIHGRAPPHLHPLVRLSFASTEVCVPSEFASKASIDDPGHWREKKKKLLGGSDDTGSKREVVVIEKNLQEMWIRLMEDVVVGEEKVLRGGWGGGQADVGRDAPDH